MNTNLIDEMYANKKQIKVWEMELAYLQAEHPTLQKQIANKQNLINTLKQANKTLLEYQKIKENLLKKY